jgi:hypothetical protein
VCGGNRRGSSRAPWSGPPAAGSLSD